MNRRRLLQLLAGGLTLDPERALWTPGAKLISIPAPRAVAPIIPSKFFNVGDVITFAGVPGAYIVTAVEPHVTLSRAVRDADALQLIAPPMVRVLG